MRSRRLLTLAFVLALAAWPTTASAGITEYTGGLTAASAPTDITTGADGNLWFTEQGLVGGIGRITPSGAITEYLEGLTPGFSIGQRPSHIAAGPDSALWFTEEAGLVGRLDPATGTVTEYGSGITAGSKPSGIALGPDGNLWFTERGGDGAIARITPGGLVTEYTTGLTVGGEPTDIVTGPDDKLWFTLSASPGAIGRIDPATGTIATFSTGLSAGGGPSHIVAHSSGKLFFTEAADPGRIGRVNAAGKIKEYTAGLTPDQAPTGIAEGGDGAIWFTTRAAPGGIGRLLPGTAAMTEFPGGAGVDLTGDSGPTGITRGPDGNVWFTESAVPGRIGRVTVPPRAKLELGDSGDDVVQHDDDGVLEARIAANSQPTTYHVEYGPDESYGTTTVDRSAGAGAGAVTHVIDLPLQPRGQYHARVVATNASGDAVSDDLAIWVTADGDIVASEPGDDDEPTPTPTPSATPAPDAATPPTDSPAQSGDDDTGPTTAASPLAPPALGEAVVVRPLSGSIRFKAPGAAGYSLLGAGARLPVGSLVDARRGHVVLQSARDAHGRTQNGTFWGSVFQVRQRRDGRGVTDLVLRGGDGFGRCGARAGASSLARDAAGPRHTIRRLWGKDRHARFRTHGRDSVATVRGTEWVTTDRCDGTLTKVRVGKVLVRDLHRKRSVLLTAGHAYLARHSRR